MLSIYLHWRGAFGVARFDLQGNANSVFTIFICGTNPINIIHIAV
ncbi:hypothetical protein EVA_16806 [gut metagenome]|uniref:Uncharacterized protein n=1 Tax=gut metagenome TaxID=749906 RepID=J9FKZ9_9ZZZZ